MLPAAEIHARAGPRCPQQPGTRHSNSLFTDFSKTLIKTINPHPPKRGGPGAQGHGCRKEPRCEEGLPLASLLLLLYNGSQREPTVSQCQGSMALPSPRAALQHGELQFLYSLQHGQAGTLASVTLQGL